MGKKVHGNNDADAKRISRQRRNDLWNNDKCARRNQQNAQSKVFHRFSDKAFHARGKEERSKEHLRRGLNDIRYRADQENRGIIHEGIRCKERHNRVPEACPARFPRIAASDTGRGERRKAHRRGDLRENAKVKHEHICRQPVDAELRERGDKEDVGDHVRSNRRQRHTEQHASDHGEHQRKEHTAAAELHHERGELRGKAGVYDNADNDTDRCRGDSNASCLLTADEHGVPYVLPRHALGVDDVQHENNRDGICRRAHQRHTGNDEIHQNDRRKQEIYAREDWLNVKALRFNIIGIFPGDKVNNEENGKDTTTCPKPSPASWPN